MSDFKAKITAELDTSQVEQKIKELDGRKIKFSADGGNAQKEVEKVDNSIKSATKSTKTFGDTLKSSAKIGAAYSLTSQAFHLIRDAANDAKEAIKDFDSSVMDLRIATGGTYKEVSNLVKGYNALGKEMGAVTKEVSDGANSWLRQGHSIGETNTLIRDSMILSKVANLEAADSTQYLTSAMKGYKVEVENVIGICDKLMAVDLSAAVDAGGLAEAMSKTAVSANAAEVSMDKLLGYLAATGEVTQESMSVIGNAFKTFFARYSAIKSGKLELIDEDGTIEVLSDVEQSLKNVGIDIRSTITDFDNAGEVLDNLAEKWDNLNSTQKNAIASAFGGTRQKERFLVLMENYGKATEYMEVSMNSAGTAEQKFEAYLDSLEAKTKSLQASFESLAINTFSTELFGGIIDATSSIVTFLDKTNLLKGTLVGLTAAGAIKGFTMLTTGITNASIRLNEFNSALKLVKAGNIGENEVQMLAKMTANLSQSQLKAVLSSKALSAEQRIAILTAQGLSKSEAEAALSSMGLATAEGAATTSTFTLSGALKGLWATLMANPLFLVATAVAGVVTIFSNMAQAAEEAEQKAEEYYNSLQEQANASQETSNSLKSLIFEYKELADSFDGSWNSTEFSKLENIQNNITELVGDQADNLDLVNGKIDEEYQKLLAIYGMISQESYDDAESAYKAAQLKMDKGYQRETTWYGSSKEESFLADWYIRRAYEELYGVDNTGDSGSNRWWGNQAGFDSEWLGDIPTALEAIGDYEEGLEKLKEWRRLLLDAQELNDPNSENGFFGDSYGNYYQDSGQALTYIDSKIAEYEAIIEEYDNAKERFFNEKANREVLDYLTTNDIDTQQQFNEWINKIWNDESISKDYAESLITTMAKYLPGFEIPQEVRRAFIKDRDEFLTELNSKMPETSKDAFGAWIDGLTDAEYQAFVDWWAENQNNEFADFQSMVDAFNKYQEINKKQFGSTIQNIVPQSEIDKVDTLASKIASIQDVLNSQSTGKSISLEDFNSEELADFSSALEYNNGVMQLNAEKVREIVNAKTEEAIATNNANKSMAQSKYLQNAAEIEKLRKKLVDKDFAEGESADTVQENIDALLEENKTLKLTCDTYDLMTSSLEEATNAYNNWLNAQNASQSGDMFDDTLDAMNCINETLNDTNSEFFGRVGRTDYQAAIELIVPDSIDREDAEKVNSYLQSVYDLFTYDDDGNYAGLNIANFCQKAVDAGLMVLDESGENYLIAGSKTMEDFAEGLNLSLPLVQAMFGEMEEFGGKFSWADEANKTIGDLAVSANVAAENLRELHSDMTISLDVSDLTTAKEKSDALDATIKQMQDLKATVGVDAEEVEYANSIIAYCITQKQQLAEPAILDVDISKVSETTGEAVSLVQEFQRACNDLELKQAFGLDTTDAQAKVDELYAQISSSDNDALLALKLDTTSVETVKSSIAELTIDDIKAKLQIDDTALLSYQPEDKQATVKYDIDTSKVDNYNPKNLSRTVTYYVRTVGSVQANGTAHLTGTAKAGGDWGTAQGGKTLTGELGREIVVDPRTGRWYTVGDTGAEFVNIPKGAIVFNHKQSESLLKNGYVAGRASALVGGTAMVTGGIGVGNANNSSNSGGNSTSNYKNSSSSNSSNSDDESEVFDWIEVAIDRIERAIDRLKRTAESTYKALKTKLGATADEITKVNQEIRLQQQAYDRYMQQANSVGLSSDLAEKVQNGSIQISEYDEDTQELIKNFENWYNKALDCADAVEELHENLAKLYADRYSAIEDDFDSRLEMIEHLENQYSNGIELIQAKG